MHPDSVLFVNQSSKAGNLYIYIYIYQDYIHLLWEVYFNGRCYIFWNTKNNFTWKPPECTYRGDLLLQFLFCLGNPLCQCLDLCIQISHLPRTGCLVFFQHIMDLLLYLDQRESWMNSRHSDQSWFVEFLLQYTCILKYVNTIYISRKYIFDTFFTILL